MVPNLNVGCRRIKRKSTLINALCPTEHLTQDQRSDLHRVIVECFIETGKKVGCTTEVKGVV